MNLNALNTIGVVGTGTMGRGIVISCASSRYKVLAYDINGAVTSSANDFIKKTLAKAVEKGKMDDKSKDEALNNINYTSSFDKLSEADFIIEAAPESIELKKEIFSKLDTVCRENIILATNTSSLSVTQISTFVKQYPERVIGMHFFNPANIMKLVEIVKGDFTSIEVVEFVGLLSKKIGKVPVVAKDTPAFIVNRIARPFYGEALKILSEGTAEVETIDRIMKRCGGFAMGPFELMDLIGIDVNFSVTKSVYKAYFNDPKYRPNVIQKKMVDSNLLGRKTGRGFYKYEQ